MSTQAESDIDGEKAPVPTGEQGFDEEGYAILDIDCDSRTLSSEGLHDGPTKLVRLVELRDEEVAALNDDEIWSIMEQYQFALAEYFGDEDMLAKKEVEDRQARESEMERAVTMEWRGSSRRPTHEFVIGPHCIRTEHI